MNQQQMSLRYTELTNDQLSQNEDVLKHYGVPGMKWGRRRARSVGDGKPARPPAKGYRSSDSKKVSELKVRKPAQLTNKQLKTVNERLNLEKNYRSLNPNTLRKGHTTVKEIVTIAGTTAAAIGVASKFFKSPTGQRLVKKGLASMGKGKLPAPVAVPTRFIVPGSSFT